MKKLESKVPGLSFKVTETGNKSTRNAHVIHTDSGLPVASFVSVKNPATLVRIANEELQHPTYWTQSADELKSNMLELRHAVFQLQKRVHSDRYGHKTVV